MFTCFKMVEVVEHSFGNYYMHDVQCMFRKRNVTINRFYNNILARLKGQWFVVASTHVAFESKCIEPLYCPNCMHPIPR